MLKQLAKKIAAHRIYVELIPVVEQEHARKFSRPIAPWWKRETTTEPIETAVEKMLDEILEPVLKELSEYVNDQVNNCRYCGSTGTLQLNEDMPVEQCLSCAKARYLQRRLAAFEMSQA